MSMEDIVKQLGPALLEAFREVPDPRSPLGRRHPLPAILFLAVCSMLCNCHSLYAIYQWGREHAELAPLLGFKGTKTPATLLCTRYSNGWTGRLSRRRWGNGPKGN